VAHIGDSQGGPERKEPPQTERQEAQSELAALEAQSREPSGAAGRSPLLRARVEALQRTAGNRATAAVVLGRSLLQRLKDSKSYAGLDPVAAVRKALADDNESDAHELMRRLESKEQANEVLQKFQSLAVKCFGDETMATAAQILVSKGGQLGPALAWMVDEGTNWTRMSRVIGAASLEEKQKLRGGEWMKWWVDRLGNKEMAALVKRLPLDLPSKLQWMKAEGSDWGLMKDVIESVPPPERTKVVEDDTLRGFFVSECNDKEMYEAVKLLGGRLSKQLAWMAAEDCEDGWVKERITTLTDAKDRIAVYGERIAWDRLLKLSDKDRVEMAKLLGGNPDQQLSLFQSDVDIKSLTWATPSADWVAALMKHRRNPLDTLEVAKSDPTGWAPFVGPQLWNLFQNFHNTIYPEDRMKPFWEAFGNGSAFSAAQIMHFIGVLTGKEPIGGVPGKAVAGDQFWARDPDNGTARAFMELLKPGGSSGAGGISREELAIGKLAFCSHEMDSTGTWQPIKTSYFADPWIIIAINASGTRNTNPLGVDSGTPTAVGTGLNFFENHARHEIGHAVGARKRGTMEESGNEFAERYGSWKKSSKANFEAALWSNVARPATGWPAVPILGTNVTLTNQDVHDWCMDVMAKGTEPANPIGNAGGDLQDKLTAIQGSLWGGVKLVNYMVAIRAHDIKGIRDNAYEFGGFTPTDPVQIFATRWGNEFVEYSKAAHNAFMGISWYALSSPPEMFAEMYTARYAQKVLPIKVGAADPLVFFRTLESQRDPMFGSKKK
jgi:hypothetical protein